MHPLQEWCIVVFNVVTVKFSKFHGGAVSFQVAKFDRSKMSKVLRFRWLQKNLGALTTKEKPMVAYVV